MRNKGFTIIEVLVGLAVTSIVLVGLIDIFGKFSLGNLQFCNSTQNVLAVSRAFDLFERDMDRFVSVRGKINSKRFSYDTSDGKSNSWITYEVQKNTIRRVAKEPNNRQGTNILLTFDENASFNHEDSVVTFEIDGFVRSIRIDWSDKIGKRETDY
ncbi:MAG: prepilin-type N-terminal cleavage/methylation domain-containing protein [Kosmotogaceae bacterium]